MRHAIAVSTLGLGTTSPNPPVGCVVLDAHGRQIGVGYHQRKGEPHAEARALAEAGTRARGGTAIVTLEPCNHVGVTPACRQLLLDAEISRVVIAAIDPTSRGEGGAAILAAAGVDVEVDVLTDEAHLVLGPWLTATARQRPWVTMINSAADAAGLPSDIAAASGLREQSDIVIGEDRRIEEGIVGGHGKDMLHFPATFATAEPVASLVQLYHGGVRTVLVTNAAVGQALLTVDAVDQVVIDLARKYREGSRPLPEGVRGFHVQAVAAVPGAVRVVMRRP
jgi:diaminohydroxyphosphoribosylaminopyrimidine deaminase/5-amino-6-(5-phosphoribosylamino)uracil reductase